MGAQPAEWKNAVGRGVLSLEWANDVEEAGGSQEKGKLQTVDREGGAGTQESEGLEAICLGEDIAREAVAEKKTDTWVL